jgi:hypothetical protein
MERREFGLVVRERLEAFLQVLKPTLIFIYLRPG